MYPQSLPLAILESQHPQYKELLPQINDIHLLTAGGYRLKQAIKQFIPRRNGEEAEVYETRIKKFTFSPILSNAITSQISKLSKGSIEVSGLESDPNFWAYFREHNDLAGKRAEKQLLAQIFTSILKYKKAYLHIDRKSAPVKAKNKAQEKVLNLNPYVNVYCASQVTNWSEDSAESPTWIKVRQLTQDTSNPMAPALTVATWTFIDQQEVAKYSAFVKLDSNGQIVEILDEKGEAIATKEEAKVPLASITQHNVGSIPIVKVELSDELWVGDQAVAKAIQHLRTECHKYDIETLSYVQRQWNPIQTPDSDPSKTYVDSEEQAKTGPQYVLQGNFEWKEAEGKILPQLEASLQQTKQEVEDIISGRSKSGTNKGALEQSGLSKAFDLSDENEQITLYGAVLTQAYQNILQLVAKVQGLNSDIISVTGLQDFNIDNAESLLAKLTSISAIDLSSLKDKLPPLVLKILYSKLSEMLVGNMSASQSEELTKQIESLLANTVAQPVSVAPVIDLAAA
ncbi:MAG TPA: hypothetical protein V6C84_18835 [Coleofasciculaceae cyanobacterium]|jgi:hypothetical protein